MADRLPSRLHRRDDPRLLSGHHQRLDLLVNGCALGTLCLVADHLPRRRLISGSEIRFKVRVGRRFRDRPTTDSARGLVVNGVPKVEDDTPRLIGQLLVIRSPRFRRTLCLSHGGASASQVWCGHIDGFASAFANPASHALAKVKDIRQAPHATSRSPHALCHIRSGHANRLADGRDERHVQRSADTRVSDISSAYGVGQRIGKAGLGVSRAFQASQCRATYQAERQVLADLRRKAHAFAQPRLWLRGLLGFLHNPTQLCRASRVDELAQPSGSTVERALRLANNLRRHILPVPTKGLRPLHLHPLFVGQRIFPFGVAERTHSCGGPLKRAWSLGCRDERFKLAHPAARTNAGRRALHGKRLSLHDGRHCRVLHQVATTLQFFQRVRGRFQCGSTPTL